VSNMGDLQRQVHETAKKKGWWDESMPRDFGMLIALMHSELSEALEAWREGSGPLIYPDDSVPKPEGWGIELADCVIRIMDACEFHNVPLDELIQIKMRYNETRPYRHGGKRA